MAITTLYANGVLDKLVKRKGFNIAIKVVVVILIVISLRFILLTILIAGISYYDFAKPYEKQAGIENYDKEYLIDTYGNDLDSGLFVFPDDTDSAIDISYESALKTGLFDTDGSIFLVATYSEDGFKREIERLSQITCTVFETNFEDSDYHVAEIKYDTEMYKYPAYVASDGYRSVYEYALVDEDENKIIYAYLSYPDITNGVRLVKYMDYLKKDKAGYVFSGGSSLNNFSIYSFHFSRDIWVEYTPEDEGRVSSGNPR